MKKFLPSLILIVSLTAFTFGLSELRFQMIDTRFALFIHELAEKGFSVFPTLYGNYYPDYTSGPTLLSFLFTMPFGGEVNPLTAVLPSAFAGALIVLLTFLLGRKMYDGSDLAGGIAAGLLFMSFEFLSMCRIISIDLYPALAAVFSFWCFETGKDRKSETLPLLYFPAIIFGFAMRGPIGAIIPASVMVAWHIPAGKWKRMIVYGIVSVLSIAGMFALLAWSAKSLGDEFWKQFLSMQFFDRAKASKAPWYFFTNAVGSYALTYPLALFATGLLLFRMKGKFFRPAEGNETLRFLQSATLWMFLILFGMSIPGTKHLRYVVAMVPAAALLSTSLFVASERIPSGKLLSKIFCLLAQYLPAVAALILIPAAHVLENPLVAEKLGFSCHIPLFFPVILLSIAQIVLIFNRKKPMEQRTLLAIATIALIFVLVRTTQETVEQAAMPSHIFVHSVEKLRTEGRLIYFYGLGPDGDENKYMVHVKRPDIFEPRYIFPSGHVGNAEKRDISLAEINHSEKCPPDSMIVARKDRWESEVPLEIRAKFKTEISGKIGRRNCVLLIRK